MPMQNKNRSANKQNKNKNSKNKVRKVKISRRQNVVSQPAPVQTVAPAPSQSIGGKIGSWIGDKAQSLFTGLLGLGEYTVNSNSLVAGTDPPVFKNTLGATHIKHREYIQDVTGSTSFNISTYPINPGQGQTFPWLSSLAQSFEQYRLLGIVFEFKSTSAFALNSTNTALGTVTLATQYNPNHPAFSDKRTMENYEFATSAPPSSSVLHPVECAPDQTVLREMYVRTANTLAANDDLRFYDLGNFYLATSGMQASAVIGELWVTYEVEFLKPLLSLTVPISGPLPPLHLYWNSTTTSSLTAPAAGYLFIYNGANTMATATGGDAALGNYVSIYTLASNALQFSVPGNYMLLWCCESGTSGSNPAMTFNANSYATLSIIQSGTGTGYVVNAPQPGVGSRNYMIASFINVASTDISSTSYCNWSSVTLPSSMTDCDFFIFPLPDDFNYCNKIVDGLKSGQAASSLLGDRLTLLESRINRLIDSETPELVEYVPEQGISHRPNGIVTRPIRTVPLT